MGSGSLTKVLPRLRASLVSLDLRGAGSRRWCSWVIQCWSSASFEMEDKTRIIPLTDIAGATTFEGDELAAARDDGLRSTRIVWCSAISVLTYIPCHARHACCSFRRHPDSAAVTALPLRAESERQGSILRPALTLSYPPCLWFQGPSTYPNPSAARTEQVAFGIGVMVLCPPHPAWTCYWKPGRLEEGSRRGCEVE